MRIKRNSLEGHNLFSAYRDVSGATLLHKAVEQGDYDKIRFYARFPQLVEARDYSGETALHYCASTNAPIAAQILIEFGAEINAVNDLNQTPLMLGVLLNSTPFVKYILRVRPSTRNNRAVADNQVEKDCVDPFIQDYKGFTVAHYADLYGSRRMKQTVEIGLAKMGFFAVKTEDSDFFNPSYLTLFNLDSHREYLLRKGERLLGWR